MQQPLTILPSGNVYRHLPPDQPVFLTKAQRAALALERRQAELEAQQKREREEREERERFVAQASGAGQGQGNGQGYAQQQGPSVQSHGHGGAYQGYDRFGNGRGGGGRAAARGMSRGRAPPAGPRGVPTGPRSFAPSPLSQGPITRGDAPTPPPPPPSGGPSSLGRPLQEALIDDTDLETIRARYLGTSNAGKKKPRARAPGGEAGGGGKQKFVFDWDAAEDTSAGAAAGQPGAGTMFGGRLAGFDEGGERRGVAGGAND